MRFSTVLVIAVSLSTFALAQERKIRRAELAPAVEKTVATESWGATIQGFSQETEHGETYYEAEGEEPFAFGPLPSEVKQGFQSKAGSGKILKVERLTKHGKFVANEAKIISNDKMREVQVGPTATLWVTKNEFARLSPSPIFWTVVATQAPLFLE
jgi:hypothetical protein